MLRIAASTTAELQTWIAVIGALATAILGLLKYFQFRTRSERLSAVGQFFGSTVDSLASTDPARQFAGAILLRRFFDPHSEQGGKGAPYANEARGVIAALLRDAEPGNLQKVLADGLGFARTLKYADLQHCHLQDAYLGARPDRTPDLSGADLYKADLSRASLRGAKAVNTVFYDAVLCDTVLIACDLRGANFSGADLNGARFTGAVVSGARFDGATNIPQDVAGLLDGKGRMPDSRAPLLVRLLRRLRPDAFREYETIVGAEG